MRTDPSETGGLFVGRRPGIAPVHYRELPKRGSYLRRRFDGSLAGILLAGIIIQGSPAFACARARAQAHARPYIESISAS